MPEIWKPIPSTHWAASSHGRVKIATDTGYTGGPNRNIGHILKFRPMGPGGYYGAILQTPEGKKKLHTQASLVARAFHGPRPPELRIHFKDFDKSNCSPSNLSYKPLKQIIQLAQAAKRYCCTPQIRINRIIEYRKRGLNCEQIKNILHCSHRTAAKYTAHLGIQNQIHTIITPKLIQRMQEYKAKGYAPIKIALILHVNENTVRRRVFGARHG